MNSKILSLIQDYGKVCLYEGYYNEGSELNLQAGVQADKLLEEIKEILVNSRENIIDKILETTLAARAIPRGEDSEKKAKQHKLLSHFEELFTLLDELFGGNKVD